jgi:TolB-like protein
MHRRVLDEQCARASSPDVALTTARKRAALDPLDTEVNARLLERWVAVDGKDRARAALGGMRERFRAEGLSDHGLGARWGSLEPAAALDLPDKPSVAVWWFSDLGGHEDGPVLAEGLSAALTHMLGRFHGLFVSARASSARFSGGAKEMSAAGRLLSVSYLVRGITQRLNQRVRLTARLVDAQHHAVVWREHLTERSPICSRCRTTCRWSSPRPPNPKSRAPRPSVPA